MSSLFYPENSYVVRETVHTEVVLHDISIYRLDIKCEPKTDYEQCLKQLKMPNIGLIFKILNNILMKFLKKL